MDLSRIEMWTQKTLEAEARRRGIRDPHLRGRAELVRLILRSQYGPSVVRGRKRVSEGLVALGQARDLLEAAVDAAAGALPKPLGDIVQLSLPFRRTSPGTIEAPVEPPEPPKPPKPHTAGPPDDAEAQGRSTPATPQVGRSEAQPASTRAVADSTPRRSESARGPRMERFVQEPIRTHSMARLLARQGHRQRALAIYEELLARNTDEPTLLEEAAILRAGGELQGIPDELPAPPSGQPVPRSDDHIECGAEDGGLGVTWQVTPQGTARAAAVLGQPGELAVRLVAIRPDPERVVKSEITEYGPVEQAGSWRAAALDQTSRCFVAIGLRADKRFVSIAHTRA